MTLRLAADLPQPVDALRAEWLTQFVYAHAAARDAARRVRDEGIVDRSAARARISQPFRDARRATRELLRAYATAFGNRRRPEP